MMAQPVSLATAIRWLNLALVSLALFTEQSPPIRTHQVEDQQLGVVLLHGFTDTVVPEGQTLLFLSDKK